VPQHNCLQHLADFDASIWPGLEGILNVLLDDVSWTQVSLPVSLGGLGVSSAVDLAVPAFLSSTAATADLVSTRFDDQPAQDPEIEAASVLWNALSENAPRPVSNSQRNWETPTQTIKARKLLENADTPRDKARLPNLKCYIKFKTLVYTLLVSKNPNCYLFTLVLILF